MKITAIKCKKCGDIIYSRCLHDYHSCSCGSCAIDGGFDYVRLIGFPEDCELQEIEISIQGATKNPILRRLYMMIGIKKRRFKPLQQVTMRFTIQIEEDEETGWYVGQCLEIPSAMSQGKTIKDLMANIKEAIELAIECQKE